ncbi:hypothetical protein O3G_MSEX014102 [Manduca sexta]|uniref:Uncharacterized protein n=1 Tax=Manduca sexta TaxID=7130 RepID=A0A922D0L8_MANSE|nr:hypothetical protein O3G_MSEX014102 [Manduca sexta]
MTSGVESDFTTRQDDKWYNALTKASNTTLHSMVRLHNVGSTVQKQYDRNNNLVYAQKAIRAHLMRISH